MIAISYRRQDSLPIAGRLYDRLQGEFGKGKVFMDFDSIPYGVDFRQHIKDMLDRSQVLLALIGPDWLGRVGRQKKRRIDDPADFVRLEIAYAFERKIPVIPILIGKTTMPKPENLPSDIADLAFRNGITLDVGLDFHHHADRLVGGINRLIIESARSAPRQGSVSSKPVMIPKPAAPKDSAQPTRDPILPMLSKPLEDTVLFRESELLEIHPKKAPQNVTKATPPTPDLTTLTDSTARKISATKNRERSPRRGAPYRFVVFGLALLIVVVCAVWMSTRRHEAPATAKTNANANQQAPSKPSATEPPVSSPVSGPLPEFAGPEESKLGRSKFEEARAAYEQKDFAAAKILAEQADMILPNQAYTLNLLGQILDRMGRSDNAEAAFRKAIAADPHFEEAENNLKDILAVKRAASTPKVALSHVPQSANSIDRMAARVKCEQAREAFQRHAVLAAKAILAEAASMNPTEACVYNLRGQILREEQHLTLAEAEFRTSIKLDPGFKDPQSNLESLMAAKQAGAANIDPPNEEMETAASRSNIEDFVRHFITVNQSKDVDAITSCYSDVVEYFGERRNRTYVREDVRKYIERWPVRQDVIEGDIQVQEEDPEDYNVGFKLNFYAGDTGGEWTRGQFTVHLRVTAATGTPKISEIKEDVVLRRKGTNKSNNPTAATTDRVQILQGSRPAYPPEAEHRGETGSGRFNIQFDDRGSATAVEIVQSTGSKILDENTIAALKSWHAVAGKAGSLVVPITYTKPNRPAPPKPGATPSSPRRR